MDDHKEMPDEKLTAFVTVIFRPDNEAKVFVCLAQEELERQLLEYCKGRWKSLKGAPRLHKVDDLEVIQTYFRYAGEYLIYDDIVEVF